MFASTHPLLCWKSTFFNCDTENRSSRSLSPVWRLIIRWWWGWNSLYGTSSAVECQQLWVTYLCGVSGSQWWKWWTLNAVIKVHTDAHTNRVKWSPRLNPCLPAFIDLMQIKFKRSEVRFSCNGADGVRSDPEYYSSGTPAPYPFETGPCLPSAVSSFFLLLDIATQKSRKYVGVGKHQVKHNLDW